MKPIQPLLLLLGLSLMIGAAPALAKGGPPLFETPEITHLRRGVNNLKDGYYRDALASFERAALYGEKHAQKTIGMMYVQGIGVERDWAKAYAWLKLAATHGDPDVASARDEVLAQLKPAEKRRLDREVSKVEKEYGDSAALERREEWVRKQKREITGSRTGQSAAVRIQVSDATGYTWEVPGPHYFELLYGSYILEFREHMGEVEIGEFKLVDDETGEGSGGSD